MSKDKPLPVINAGDDPQALQLTENMVSLMRIALAPMLNRAGDDLPHYQSVLVSAAAIMGGMTVGHMAACGQIQRVHVKQFERVAGEAFKEGIRLGRLEAERAIQAQRDADGTTVQ